jgi:protoporphyrinogen oxidase
MKYEQTTAAEWIKRYAGPEVYRVIWHPLLRGKFGSRAEDVSMTWFWGKMRLRFGSRKGLVKESLGYMTGSFQVLIDAMADSIRSKGGVIRVAAEVTGITVRDGRACGVQTSAGSHDQADAVIATVPCFAMPGLAPSLTPEYTARLNRIQYQAALVLVIQVSHSLSRIYWLNVSDPGVPFVAAIEQTNFLPLETYGGRRLVYCSNYVAPDSPLLAMSAAEVVATYTAGLQRINPDVRADWVEDAWLFKDRAGQPVVTRGYSKLIPDHRTPIAGLYLANTAQIYPEDRGMNYSVRLGQRIAALVHQDTAR